MSDHCFISYSAADAQEFANKLANELEGSHPFFDVWFDKQDLRAGKEDWDTQITDAIRSSRCMIFVMTNDSVTSGSMTKNELNFALRYKKPIIPLLLHREAEMPFALANRQSIDFTSGFEKGLAQLRLFLSRLDSPEGVLDTLRMRLSDAERDLHRAKPEDEQRIKSEIEELRNQIKWQEEVVRNPEVAAKQTQMNIEAGLERERRPEKPTSIQRGRFINPAPSIAPSYFQGREIETEQIVRFLNDDSQRVITIVGRAGIGKTTLVCRLLKGFETGTLPIGLGEKKIDGIVYLSEIGSHRVNFANIFFDLCKLLSDETSKRLSALYKDPNVSVGNKMLALEDVLFNKKVILLLDSLELLIDTESYSLNDSELQEALSALLSGPHTSIKIIITTRISPKTLNLQEPGRQIILNLDGGLDSVSVMNILREMDADGRVGLRNASDKVLIQVHESTRGYPRAIEAFFAILASDRYTSVEELLALPRPENLVAALVGEAYDRLDITSQKVLQALAVYNKPVTPAALDHLLSPYIPGIDSAVLLKRLTNMHFVRREAGRYYMHPVDREYAFEQIPVAGEKVSVGDEKELSMPAWDRKTLFIRGAEYFNNSRKNYSDVISVSDLGPQLNEIDLLLSAEAYNSAATLISTIDKDFLFTWGENSLLANLYSSLEGKIQDAILAAHWRERFNQLVFINKGFVVRENVRAHADEITGLLWLNNGQWLCSASKDKTVRAWNTITSEVKAYIAHTDEVVALASTIDGKKLISASSDKTIIIWDINDNEKPERILSGHASAVSDVAVHPDGLHLLSSALDGQIILWDLKTGEILNKYTGYLSDPIQKLDISPDGKHFVTSSWNGKITVWSMSEGKVDVVLPSKNVGRANDLVFSPDGTMLITCNDDGTIDIWETEKFQLVFSLQGHTAAISSASFTKDGSFLVSKSIDNTLKIWRTDVWTPLTSLGETSSKNPIGKVAFNPKEPLLASVSEKGLSIRLWDVDIDFLLNEVTKESSGRYLTTKVALVGDQGVGKSTLGWRLKYGAFQPQPSTHGEHFWILDTLRHVHSDGTVHDVILWDFAGQPDYRLVHALFLDDVDISLILFETSDRETPLKGVEYWAMQLKNRKNRPCPILLVGAKSDRGIPSLPKEDIQQYCLDQGINLGYVSTSSQSGYGIDELKLVLGDFIEKLDKAPTVSPSAFQFIKNAILALHQKIKRVGDQYSLEDENINSLIITTQQLAELLAKTEFQGNIKYDELLRSVEQMEKHGLVKLISTPKSGKVILLIPELVNNLASSYIIKARQHENGLGVLEEDLLLTGKYDFPELGKMDKDKQVLLIDATTTLFIEHNLCFRTTLGRKSLLVFPALINERRLTKNADSEIEEDISIVIEGATENIYASLVVQLGYTSHFTRTAQWHNQAEYEMTPGEICGFKQLEKHEGQIELVLYYNKKTSMPARELFQALVKKFLLDNEIDIKIYPQLVCSNCQTKQEKQTIIKRINEGKDFIYCFECSNKISVVGGITLESKASPYSHVTVREQIRAQLRTAYEATWVKFRRYLLESQRLNQKPSCFISYAWGKQDEEKWVYDLTNDLEKANIEVVLDQKDNVHIGASIPRFVQKISEVGFVVTVGTPRYKNKFENKDENKGYVVAAEFDLISDRLLGSEKSKRTVLPILLDGDVEGSFPPLLYRRKYADFRDEKNYFEQLFELIITLHQIPSDEDIVQELIFSLKNDAESIGFALA
jgi:WD40 repeat protein